MDDGCTKVDKISGYGGDGSTALSDDTSNEANMRVGRINPKNHVDVWGWILSVKSWGMLALLPEDQAPGEDNRPRGAYITKPHDTACGRYIPANSPRKDRQALAAQREVEDDPQLAAEIERLWRARDDG